MFRSLVRSCLELRVVVVAVAVLLLVEGVREARNTPIDVFPEFAPPLVEIQTEAPGLSTLEVERLVTMPLEAALGGVPFAKTLRSKSVLGLSAVVLLFEPGADLLRVRELVQERLTAVGAQLPAIARTPRMLPPLSAMSRVMKIGVSSPTLDQMELTDLVRWTVRPRLLAVAGVANVAIWGERDRQLQVRVDPERLRGAGVTLDELVRVARDAVTPTAGGFVDTPNQRIPVAHRPLVSTVEELASVRAASRGGLTIAIGELADVKEAPPPAIGDAVVGEGPGLLLIVEKQPWGNTREVTAGVDEALARLAPALPGLRLDSSIFRPASFIDQAISNLGSALLVGCGLVVFILWAFLRDTRAALVSATAIPLSLAGAAMVLHRMGGSLNTMVLAGLVIALGEVVDDAVIDVENIRRRLRLERELPSPRSSLEVVLEASLEVRSAVVYATAIVVLSFLPVFFLEGVPGAFFRPLAAAYVIAVATSMAIALTVTPALSLLLFRDGHTPREARFLVALRTRYRGLLERVVERPKAALLGCGAVLLASGVLGLGLDAAFLPRFQERDFLMHWVGKPGTSLEAMRRSVQRVAHELRAVPGVRSFGSHIGRAEVADEVVGPNFAELWISIDPTAPYRPTVERIQQIVEGYPGLQRDVQTYLQERIKEVLSGVGSAIVVRIYGPELDGLRAQQREVEREVSGISGVAHLKLEPQVLVPQLDVRLRLESLARTGLGAGEVRRTATALIAGERVGEIYRAQQRIEVTVWGDKQTRSSPMRLRSLPLDARGSLARLGDVADIEMAPAPNLIQREGGSRRIDVSFDVEGRDLDAVVREVEAALARVKFPAGYHPELLGESAARSAARDRMLAFFGLGLLAIALVLYVDFRSMRRVALVLGTLPFALVGGVLGAFLARTPLSLGSLVGFVTVLGIAARNGIMLVAHYRHLEESEGAVFGRDMILRGAEERLAPILMTALATMIALVPIALAGGRPGYEIEHPMAVVILGGLLSSTALNLLVVPALYLRYGRANA